MRITNNTASSVYPSLVWTGTEYGVTWEDTRDGNYEIYFARINSAGVKQGGDIRITNYAGASQSPVLVWTGAEYGLAWDDSRTGDIYFAIFNSGGTKR